MKNTPKSADQPEDIQSGEEKKKDEHAFNKWKDPEKNKMGNDITGDMKIANSNGELEGGHDKRWHLEDDDQD
ncbi:MAG: hypothetical protein H0X41_05195 [Chitinophagaceae bacterium]|nr:hypothetical protein [Chitinophagaceae bacterium]